MNAFSIFSSILSLIALHFSSFATTPILSATKVVNSNDVQVTWGETDVNTSSSDVSLHRYQIIYGILGQDPITIDNIGNTQRNYTVSGLSEGHTYEFKVVEVIRVNLPPSPFTPPFLETFTASTVLSVLIPVSNTPPIARCKNVEMALPPNASNLIAAAQWFNNGSFDPENNNLSYSLSSYGTFEVGTHYLTFTIKETSTSQLYSASCPVKLKVVDNSPPVINLKNAVVYLNFDGYTNIDPTQFDLGTYDNTAYFQFNSEKRVASCKDVGIKPFLVTATDQYGNSSQKLANLHTIDNTVPYIQQKPIKVTGNEKGIFIVDQEMIDSLVYDACGIKSVVLEKDTFQIGKDSLKILATDIHNNLSAVSIEVQVYGTSNIDSSQKTNVDSLKTVKLDTTLNQATSYSDLVRLQESNLQNHTTSQLYSVSPNPVSDQVTISFQNSPNSDYQIVIKNHNGKVLNQFLSSTKNYTIKMNRFEKGTYYIDVVMNGNKTTKRIWVR